LRADDPDREAKLQPNARGPLSFVSHDGCDYASLREDVLAPVLPYLTRANSAIVEKSFCRLARVMLTYNFQEAELQKGLS
jgi:hypothetical protein